MIMIYGKDLDEIYEQIAIIEDALENGATCGIGASEDEIERVLDFIL